MPRIDVPEGSIIVTPEEIAAGTFVMTPALWVEWNRAAGVIADDDGSTYVYKSGFGRGKLGMIKPSTGPHIASAVNYMLRVRGTQSLNGVSLQTQLDAIREGKGPDIQQSSNDANTCALRDFVEPRAIVALKFNPDSLSDDDKKKLDAYTLAAARDDGVRAKYLESAIAEADTASTLSAAKRESKPGKAKKDFGAL